MAEKIRLGVIGIGNMGSAHAKSVFQEKCPDFVLTAVADSNPQRLTWAQEEFGEAVARFDTAQALIDSGLVDACIIAVPHYDHPSCAIACMQRNLHVLVEKPAGVYTKQVMEMNAEADKHPELKFGMMFNQRTNHIYRKLHELITSGVYGQIRRTNWIITNWYRPQSYYDSGAWRATWAGEGGGVLLNQCPHQLDLWQWICGMPVRVHRHQMHGTHFNALAAADAAGIVYYITVIFTKNRHRIGTLDHRHQQIVLGHTHHGTAGKNLIRIFLMTHSLQQARHACFNSFFPFPLLFTPLLFISRVSIYGGQ